MKTQISRDAHRPEKRYSGVYQQQGRMLTDADWNALGEIVKQRLDDALADVVGSGAPREGGLKVHQDSFTPPALPPPLTFVGSRLYAGGVPARVVPKVVPAQPGDGFAYEDQADFPGAPPPPLGTVAFTLYADVWERAVVSLEDGKVWAPDHLRDPALHGADSTTRTQTMAQVKWCPDPIKPEDANLNPSLGNARLTVKLSATTGGADPCDPCASAVGVDQRVGNYLFRLEIHDVKGPANAPTEVTFKWSSENGAEQHLVENVPEEFKTGGFVYELYNDVTEKLLGVHLATGTPPRVKLEETFTTAPSSPPPPSPTPLPKLDRIRRWDGYAVLNRTGNGWSLVQGKDNNAPLNVTTPRTNPGALELVHLIFPLKALDLDLSIRNGLDRFVAGDYWLAVVRESVHKAGDTVLAAALPTGIVHHYLPLAQVDVGGALKHPTGEEKLRSEFLPLTKLQIQDASVGCRVTIGEGGRYSDLETAILDLLSKPKLDMCLCFLPGDHRFVTTRRLQILAAGRVIHLSICGCGPGSRLLIDGSIDIDGAASLELRDLALHIEAGASITALQCGQIAFERLVVTGTATGDLAPFQLEASSSIRVAGCQFHFPESGRLVHLGNLLKDRRLKHPDSDLSGLFSDGLDDDRFSAESLRVAQHLVPLPLEERLDISSDLVGIAKNPAFPRVMQNALEQLSKELGSTAALTIVTGHLSDIRQVALKTLSPVLALDAVAGDVTLVDNQILGEVSVYGDGDPDAGKLPDLIDFLRLDNMNNNNQIVFNPAGRLSVTGNTISRLSVGKLGTQRLRELAQNIPGDILVYRTANLTENRFTVAESSVLAQDVRLTNNVFDFVTGQDQFLGWAFSRYAVYMGNSRNKPFGLFRNYSYLFQAALNPGEDQRGVAVEIIVDKHDT